MIFIETHAHYNDEKFNEDIDEVITEAHNMGIEKIVNVSFDIPSSNKTVDIVNKYAYVYGAIGVHPTEFAEDNFIDQLKELYIKNNKKIVAIGEIGLDYYWEKEESAKQKQIKRVIMQIELANELKLPVIIHCRDAAEDMVKVLKQNKPLYGCVFHCYQPNDATIKYIIENDMYISLTGNITFKRNEHFYETIKKMSLNRIMLETDSPYMSPEPNRGKRNSSKSIPIIAKKLAEIMEVSVEEIADITYENSMRFFSLK
ncbi:MAG: TatD family hydrolase [Clostridia bacterium]